MRPDEHPEYGKIRGAVEYIKANFDQAIRLADIADQTDLSMSRMCHVFKDVMQVAPVEYLMEIRIEHARRLLATTRYSCSEIAQMTGHSSVSYFSKVFKRITGESPIEFRRKQRT